MKNSEQEIPDGNNVSSEEIPQPAKDQPKPAAPSTSKSQPDVSATPPGKSKPARPLRWRLLRWVVGLLIVFGLGVLWIILQFYLPARNQVSQLQGELSAANAKISELQNQISNLSSTQVQSGDLKNELDQANLHVALLSARYDIVQAQLALEKKDPSKAHLALTKTPKTFETIATMLPANQQKTITDLQDRLKLAISEIDTNTYAAQSDLDVLATSLLELENALFTSG